MKLAQLLARAWATVGRGWVYKLGGKPAPDTAATAAGTAADCTGWIWWATGRRQSGRLNTAAFGSALDGPAVGAAVWYDAIPPAGYGHAGLIVKVHSNGDFDTLDCSSSSPANRRGAIRHLRNARAFWSRGGQIAYRRPANVSGDTLSPPLLFAGLVAAASALYWRKRRAEFGRRSQKLT
jgi:hypothetical protein